MAPSFNDGAGSGLIMVCVQRTDAIIAGASQWQGKKYKKKNIVSMRKKGGDGEI